MPLPDSIKLCDLCPGTLLTILKDEEGNSLTEEEKAAVRQTVIDILGEENFELHYTNYVHYTFGIED